MEPYIRAAHRRIPILKEIQEIHYVHMNQVITGQIVLLYTKSNSQLTMIYLYLNSNQSNNENIV